MGSSSENWDIILERIKRGPASIARLDVRRPAEVTVMDSIPWRGCEQFCAGNNKENRNVLEVSIACTHLFREGRLAVDAVCRDFAACDNPQAKLSAAPLCGVAHGHPHRSRLVTPHLSRGGLARTPRQTQHHLRVSSSVKQWSINNKKCLYFFKRQLWPAAYLNYQVEMMETAVISQVPHFDS